jgi:NADH:ubiquinone oxidoreductase subunit 2 (subunit N)
MLALSVLTMIAGTVGGLMQRKLKRVLAYSSVNATGYLLLVLSTNNIFGLASFFYYLILYVIAIFSVFVISSQIVIDNRSFISFIDDFENFYKTNKALSFLLSSFFFSLAGIPPFLGFFGKFEILGSLFFSGYLSAFLAILIVSIISFLYYARIIKAVYTKKLGNVHYLENFSFFNVVVIVFCFTLLLLGIVSSGSVHFFSQLLVFHLVSV